jgi:hypothetical protein
MWFNNNMSKGFICIQEAKAKSFDQISHWLPFSWHDNIRTNFFEDDGHAHGGVFTAINPNSDIKIISHKAIVIGRVQALEFK